jgi:GH25 family lysozyme M1 (1,4-beta-N-acetylmuramidase)
MGSFDKPDPGHQLGILISHHQGKVDWEAVGDDSRIKWVAIRVSYGAIEDREFALNWQKAADLGLPRLPWHFFDKQSSWLEQARFFVDKLTSHPAGIGELDWYGDFEEDVDDGSHGIPADMATNIYEWLSYVYADAYVYDRGAGVYTRASWWNKYVGEKSWASAFRLWTAHWWLRYPKADEMPLVPAGWNKYDIWQVHCSWPGVDFHVRSTDVCLEWMRETGQARS